MPEASGLAEESPCSPLDQSHSSSYNPSDSPVPNGATRPLKLLTAAFEGEVVALRLIVDSVTYPSPPGFAPHDSFIGHDGNKYYCQVCKELGEIVCCDGCPRAYHPECLPEQGESRSSLLRDDDPWFCPFCYASKDTPQDHAHGTQILQQAAHLPQEDYQDDKTANSHVQEEGEKMHMSAEEDGQQQQHDTSEPTKPDDAVIKNDRKRRPRAISPKPSPPQQPDDDEVASKDQDNPKKIVKKRKRKEQKEVRKRRPRSDSQVDPTRGRANAAASPPQPSSPSMERVPADPLVAALGERTHTQGLVQATPAFYYFLGENRWKIERSLSKSHRYFNRLSKGNMERNALVAKEAAIWWTKLRSAEYQRYVNMSMKDFEHRIIEWKEDKNVQEMGVAMAEDYMVEPQTMTDTEEDVDMQQELHQRLYQAHSVACKPFDKRPDVKYNSVLQATLNDVRFHASLPLIGVNRSSDAGGVGDQKAMQVHGPIATSVGDECLGCTRGWLHHCPVLQRRLPAVKRRAKNQPGLSSLVATRVGLGLDPQSHAEYQDAVSVTHVDEEIEWRNSSRQKDLDNIMPLPSSTLTDPSARADDIAQFIEEALALAIPQPSDAISDRILDGREVISSSNDCLYSCGRCRQITSADDGCLDCRRAQLVMNSTKHRTSEKTDKVLAKTIILGRIPSKEKTVELPEGDRAVAKKLLKQNWLPIAVLPPKSVPAPRPSINGTTIDEPQENLASSLLGDEHTGGVCADIDNLEELSSNHVDEPEMLTTGRLYQDPLKRLRSRSDLKDLNGKVQSDVQSKSDWTERAISIICAGMFLAIIRRDPLCLFGELVVTDHMNGSKDTVKHPIGFKLIRSRLLKDEYESIDAFSADVRRVCDFAAEWFPNQAAYKETANAIAQVLSTMENKAKAWIVGVLDVWDANDTCAERDNPANRGVARKDHMTFLQQSFQVPEDIAMRRLERWLMEEIQSDFTRTEENEVAYYASLAIHRAAVAAESSLAPYPNSLGHFSAVTKRSHEDDQALAKLIDGNVAVLSNHADFSSVPSHREKNILGLLENVRNRRQGLLRSQLDSGCSRCNRVDAYKMIAMSQMSNAITRQESNSCTNRIDSSRRFLSTGMGSDGTCKRLASNEMIINRQFTSVRKSDIHGLGLFADKEFGEGAELCEYVGEHGSVLGAEARRRQTPNGQRHFRQFSVDEASVLNATHKGGGLARYINHSCNANCVTRIVAGEEPQPHLKRVLVVTCKPIAQDEEITYDYHMPIERDLTRRIPCHCRTLGCRGFMNWTCPEVRVAEYYNMTT